MNRDKLKEDLIRDEGLKTEPYKDTMGYLTIGIGRNLDDRGISKAEAMILLENDLDIVERELDARLSWWRDLPDDAQRALSNMAFNLGVPRLLGFRKALAALSARDFETAAQEVLDSKWVGQVGSRAYRIAELIRNA